MVPNYRLAHSPHVANQIKELSKRAASLGIGGWLKESLELIVEKLERAPLRMGDPVRHPRKPGAIVHVAIVEPVSISYVVYQPEKIVLWFDLQPLSRFFPE
jgi:hypothetical protein